MTAAIVTTSGGETVVLTGSQVGSVATSSLSYSAAGAASKRAGHTGSVTVLSKGSLVRGTLARRATRGLSIRGASDRGVVAGKETGEYPFTRGRSARIHQTVQQSSVTHIESISSRHAKPVTEQELLKRTEAFEHLTSPVKLEKLTSRLPEDIFEVVPSTSGTQFKRKSSSFEEEESSQSIPSPVPQDVLSRPVAPIGSIRSHSSKGGTPKRLKTSPVSSSESKPSVDVGVTLQRTHELGIAVSESFGVLDIERSTEDPLATQLTGRQQPSLSVGDEIRAQVLQSVHSLSTSSISLGSHGSISVELQAEESEAYITESICVGDVVAVDEPTEIDVSLVAVAGEGSSVARSYAGSVVDEGASTSGSGFDITPEDSSLKTSLIEESSGAFEKQELQYTESEQLVSKEESSVSEETGGISVPEESEASLETRDVCAVCGELGPHTCSLRIFSCPDCNKSFSSRFKLSRHQLIHGGERQYRCDICERSFHRKDHLKNHRQIHEPTKQFKCERAECGKEYNSYMSYRKHCAFHSAEEGDLQCKFCYKMFDNKNDLIYHLKVHVGTRSAKSPSEKKFQCDQCDRRFFTRKDVKRHLVVHTGTRDFCCSLCPQKFGRKDHLVRHIKKSHGVTDLTRLETLADPLAIPGPSGTQPLPPLSPGLSSISTSSGDTRGLSPYIPPSPTPLHPSLESASPQPSLEQGLSLSYQDVGGPSFAGFVNDPSDLRLLGPDPIKEEPDLTASMTGLGPDLSNILGLYLPSSEGITMTGIMETPSTHTVVSSLQHHFTTSGSSASLGDVVPSSLQAPLLAFSSTSQYLHPQSLSPLPPLLHPAFSSPHTSPVPPVGPEEDDPHGLLGPAPSTCTTSSSTVTTTTASTQFLPGFDQAFP